MTCPHCQTAHADPPPRFCDACGLALPRLRVAAAPRSASAEPILIRCPECGQPATSRRCAGCGSRVRWPEHMIPPDEQDGMGKPAAPALELADDDQAATLELGEPGAGPGPDPGASSDGDP